MSVFLNEDNRSRFTRKKDGYPLTDEINEGELVERIESYNFSPNLKPIR